MTSTTFSRFMTPGRFAIAGTPVNITAADLADLAAGYDPEKFQAPVVANEPKHDDPAYGWVKSLAFKDGALHAVVDQLDPTFGAAVAAGQFDKRQVSLYPTNHPNNPTPGRPYLRHLGFTGLVAPDPGFRRAANFAADPRAMVFEVEPLALDFAAPRG